jgi:hypothetical protein
MLAATQPIRAIEVFYSYSHKDEELRDQMETHLAMLKREGVIRGWHDRRIISGQEWGGEIDACAEGAAAQAWGGSSVCDGGYPVMAATMISAMPMITDPMTMASATF